MADTSLTMRLLVFSSLREANNRFYEELWETSKILTTRPVIPYCNRCRDTPPPPYLDNSKTIFFAVAGFSLGLIVAIANGSSH